jgi:glycosidase
VLDFAFRVAALQAVAGDGKTDVFMRLFSADVLYVDGVRTARQLPTFLSNHDIGRLSQFVRKSFPQASDQEVLQRVLLAHAMMFTMRGVPVVYAGDEQGFVSDSGDQDAREDLFASQVHVYNDNRLIGTSATTAQANFNQQHPIFLGIAELARLRRMHPALRRGEQVVRHYQDEPGLLALSRVLGSEDILIVYNTAAQERDAFVSVDYDKRTFSSLRGVCDAKAAAPGSYQVRVPALDFIVCRATASRGE